MKWFLIILASLVVLIGVVVGIGAVLPKKHVAARKIHLAQDPQAVWGALTDFPAHPTWRTGLKEMRRLPDRQGRAVWQELSRHGPLTYEVIEEVAPSRLVTRMADPKLPFGGSWTYEVRGDEGGCEVTITERGEIYNPVFRFMARFVFGYEATLSGYLKDLGRRFGEEVVPEPVA